MKNENTKKYVRKELKNFIDALYKNDMLNPEIVYRNLHPQSSDEEINMHLFRNLKIYWNFIEEFLNMEFYKGQRVIRG